MSKLTLVFPSEEWEEKALEFRKEFFENGEKTIDGSYKLDMDKYSYAQWLRLIRDNKNPDTVDPKFGVSHTFFAVDNGERLIGIVNFRHTLTDFYRDLGHIGYSVRPTERRKGYTTEILKQMLPFAKEQGLRAVFLTCRKDNEASRGTILKNGGVLNRTFVKSGAIHEEFVINL